jgi:catechol 2,3-dioxygenase-like lactoylglutathione lyase family enzyme
MTVLRIIPNLRTDDPPQALVFYRDLLGLDVVMDHGWILTLASNTQTVPQISIASEGGSGTDVPDLSIEVDDVELVFRRAKQMGLKIVYDLTDEPWGVRRFYVEDPFGRIVNILSHAGH